MRKNIYKISISGLNLHHILGYFERENFHAQNLARKNEHKMVVCLPKNEYEKFVNAEISKAFKIKVLKIWGTNATINKILKHLGLALGLVVGVFVIIASTNKVYDIEFDTNGHTCKNNEQCIFSDKNKEKVLAKLAEFGIKKGEKLPSNLSHKEIEQSLVLEFEQVSGVCIKQKGTKFIVQIEEATLPETQLVQNLVCPVSGIIVSNNVVSGKLLVKNGDIVLKGQTLVVPENQKKVSATFEIRTFYHENVVYCENVSTYKKTGKTQTINSISLFNLSLKNNKKCNFSLFEKQVKKRYATYNLFLPIISTSTTYFELEQQETVVPFETVQDTLKQELYNKTKLLISQNATEKNTTFAVFHEGNKTRLDCYVECIYHLNV